MTTNADPIRIEGTDIRTEYTIDRMPGYEEFKAATRQPLPPTIGAKALELVKAAIRREMVYKGGLPLNEFLKQDNTLDSAVAAFTEDEKRMIGG